MKYPIGSISSGTMRPEDVISDLSEVPEDYSGEVLRVNDHGNATLYAAENGKLTEIWGIV